MVTTGLILSLVWMVISPARSPGLAFLATCRVTSYSPFFSVDFSSAVTPATLDSTLFTTKLSGVLRLFERRRTVRVAAVSLKDTSPKFTWVGSTRKVGRTTPATLIQYSG